MMKFGKNQSVIWLRKFLNMQGISNPCFDKAEKYSAILDKRNIQHNLIVANEDGDICISAWEGQTEKSKTWDISVGKEYTTLIFRDGQNMVLNCTSRVDYIVDYLFNTSLTSNLETTVGN